MLTWNLQWQNDKVIGQDTFTSLTEAYQASPGLIGPVCLILMSKCHKAFIDKMPRVNVSQPLVRQALFLIGTIRMFLLTNKQGDLPSLRRCYSHYFSHELFFFKMKLFFYYNTTFLSNVTINKYLDSDIT